MKVTIINVGAAKEKFILEGEDIYLKRLKPLLKINLIEIPTKAFSKLPACERIKREAQAVLARLNAEDYLVALDEGGTKFSSQEFAKQLEKHMNSATNNLVFAIGGAYGWDNSILNRAKLKLSLSDMTFTFQMTRLILVEQLYRSMTILRNIPYHKE